MEKRVKKRLKRGLHPGRDATAPGGQTPEQQENRWRALDRRTRMIRSDIDYYTKQPLTVRDGLVMVASGMRGAVTLAAAQTLPLDTPNRSTLILIAFAVAVLSLGIQGSLLAPMVRWIKPTKPDQEELARQGRALEEALSEVTSEQEPGESMMDTKLRVITARREILLDLQDEGYYDQDAIGGILASMDAIELGVRLRQSQVQTDVQGSGASKVQEVAAENAAQVESDLDAASALASDRKAVLAQAEEATRLAASGQVTPAFDDAGSASVDGAGEASEYESDDDVERELAKLSADEVAAAIAAQGSLSAGGTGGERD